MADRTFYVNINQETSTIRHICAGVPQGSVLAPTLYSIFTSDMPISENVTTATYADDTALISSDTSEVEASRVVHG